MAKCGVLENLLVKEHVHTFVNTGGDVRELDFRFYLGDKQDWSALPRPQGLLHDAPAQRRRQGAPCWRLFQDGLSFCPASLRLMKPANNP